MLKHAKIHLRYWWDGLREESKKMAAYLRHKYRGPLYPLSEGIKWIVGNIVYTFGFVSTLVRLYLYRDKQQF